MNTKETTDLAKLLTKLPGIRSIDLKDVRHLVELLRESPEIGSIEVKGWFGTGVLITRTGNHAVQVSAPMAMPMRRCARHRSAAAAAESRARRRRRPPRSRKSSRRWWEPSTARRSRAPSPT